MSSPNIMGFNAEVPYSTNRFDNAGDASRFQIGYGIPGGARVYNKTAWWRNFGYAQLIDAQLYLVANPTVDTGSDADTIDHMQFIDSQSPTSWLTDGETATPTNTSTWVIPLPNPFNPFYDKFNAGLGWAVPALGTPGIIRKAFQWDGGYVPDTWDYIYYPMGNGYFPDNNQWGTDVFTENWLGSDHIKILALGWLPTENYLEFWKSISATYYAYYQMPNAAGNPWFDNVDNPTGYAIEAYWLPDELLDANIGIRVQDGVYDFTIWSLIEGGNQKLMLHSADHTGVDLKYTYPGAPTYRTVQILVQGSSLVVKVSGVTAITATLNRASAAKTLNWGAFPKSWNHAGYNGGWGYGRFGHIKFYCGGNTIPTT